MKVAYIVSLITVHFLAVISVSAQSHLDYTYLLDAKVFAVDSTLYFRAHSYPRFSSHHDKDLKIELNQLVSSTYDHEKLPEQARLVTDLPNVDIDNLIDTKQLVDMLKARMGLMNIKLKDTSYHVDIIYDIIRFPDNTKPIFNLESQHHLDGNVMAQPVLIENHRAIDWSDGEVLMLGRFGGDELIKCVKRAILNADFENITCGESKAKDIWSESIGCETTIGEWREDMLGLYIDTRDLGCSESKDRMWHVEIPFECFESDEPCKD